MPAQQPGEADVVSLVVHRTVHTLPRFHHAGYRHPDPLARWYILGLGSRLEWNWIRAAYHRSLPTGAGSGSSDVVSQVGCISSLE